MSMENPVVNDEAPVVADPPEVAPVAPEPEPVQAIPAAVSSLRDARIAHDDAGTRKRKASLALEDAEVARTLAVDSATQADGYMDTTRDDVLAAFDSLIAAVQSARDAFRAG